CNAHHLSVPADCDLALSLLHAALRPAVPSGNPGQWLIVLVLGRERLQRGRLPPSGMILLSLGASRFCLQGPARQFFGLHWDFLNSATFWFSSWHSVLFCMKITNFTHPTFLWVKWRFPGSVPWLLMAPLLISFIVTLLFFWGNRAVCEGFLIRKFPGNMTFRQWSRTLEVHYFLPLKLITLLVPCSVFLVSVALLINSLRRHTGRMQLSAHRPQDPSAQAHTRALKSLVSFLILDALSLASLVIDAAGFFSESDWYWPWQILIYLCMSVHPFFIISSNLRLRGGMKRKCVCG
uniref:Taste receptor type 2 n=1 Tax=Panthera leo TaxID=9689 RepID=A0A8C9D6N7_PANLE